MHIFRRIFISNYWWQESDIWSQASYMYAILWEAFLNPSDSYFLFADLVGFYTHWTYIHIFRHIFLSNYWWQRSDIWSQASYRYPISWEAFLDQSDSYYLFIEERDKWALAHSSSCFNCFIAPTHHFKHTLSSLCICRFLLHTFTTSFKLVCHMKRHLTGMIWCPRLKLWRIKQWNFFVWHQGSH